MGHLLNSSAIPAAASFDFSEEQIAALQAINAWYRDPDAAQVFRLYGPAGTGKTELARRIGEKLGVAAAFVALTGKAASVMRRKGCSDAMTIHSLIYRPTITHACAKKPPCAAPPCGDRCEHARQRAGSWARRNQLEDIELVIVDEISMIGSGLGRDLLSFGIKIIALGDLPQLPPVGDGGYFTGAKPDFSLTKIHRQTAGSPVIQLATTVRLGGRLRPGQYGTSAVLARGKAPPEQLLDCDQVITHKTRCTLNSSMRRALGFTGPVPAPGEKVVCLKNDRTRGIFNGETYKVVRATPDRKGFYEMTVKGDDSGRLIDIISPIAAFGLPNNSGRNYPQNPFDWGYVIVCHKAHGSQWNSVYVVDESDYWRSEKQHLNWLYTAITRAADRVIVSL